MTIIIVLFRATRILNADFISQKFISKELLENNFYINKDYKVLLSLLGKQKR